MAESSLPDRQTTLLDTWKDSKILIQDAFIASGYAAQRKGAAYP